MIKLLIAALVAYGGWLVWRGPRRRATARRAAFPPPRRGDADALDEARALLGVTADADAATIRAAYRRLVAAAHPDHGGSAEDMRRITAARDALLPRSANAALND